MSNVTEEFITKIISTLNSHGFPDKKVSLPVEKMYEAADNRGLNFNTILEELKTKNIDTQITVDKVIFKDNSLNPKTTNIDPEMSKENMLKKAQEMVSTMTPEQLAEIQRSFENMTPEQKEEIMKQGKSMGLV